MASSIGGKTIFAMVSYSFKICFHSAWVGIGITILLFPIPGLIASRIQKIQVEKMKEICKKLGLMVVLLLTELGEVVG